MSPEQLLDTPVWGHKHKRRNRRKNDAPGKFRKKVLLLPEEPLSSAAIKMFLCSWRRDTAMGVERHRSQRQHAENSESDGSH